MAPQRLLAHTRRPSQQSQLNSAMNSGRRLCAELSVRQIPVRGAESCWTHLCFGWGATLHPPADMKPFRSFLACSQGSQCLPTMQRSDCTASYSCYSEHHFLLDRLLCGSIRCDMFQPPDCRTQLRTLHHLQHVQIHSDRLS